MLLWMDLRLSSTTGRLDLSLLEINNCDAENLLSHEVVLYARKDKLMSCLLALHLYSEFPMWFLLSFHEGH